MLENHLCCMCDKSFTSITGLKDHIIEKHRSEVYIFGEDKDLVPSGDWIDFGNRIERNVESNRDVIYAERITKDKIRIRFKGLTDTVYVPNEYINVVDNLEWEQSGNYLNLVLYKNKNIL